MATYPLTPAQFDAGLRGEALQLENGKQARHIVAAGLNRRANEIRPTDKSKASALDQLETRVRDGRGQEITKKMLSTLRKEIDNVRFSLTGFRDGEYDDEFVSS